MNNKASFSPGEDCLNDIIEMIQSAKEFLDVCVFTISDNRISDELIKAYNKGVSVRIISDNDKMNDLGSDIRSLVSNGIPVKIDNSPNFMHHKFMIVDELTILTGSYNWTRSAAQYNQENTIIVDSDEIVSNFIDAFSQLWETCDLVSE